MVDIRARAPSGHLDVFKLAQVETCLCEHLSEVAARLDVLPRESAWQQGLFFRLGVRRAFSPRRAPFAWIGHPGRRPARQGGAAQPPRWSC